MKTAKRGNTYEADQYKTLKSRQNHAQPQTNPAKDKEEIFNMRERKRKKGIQSMEADRQQ